jgi:hypothetical protein
MPVTYMRIERGLVEVKCEYDQNWHILKYQDLRQYLGALEFVLEVFVEENNKAEPDINAVIAKIKAEMQRVNK